MFERYNIDDLFLASINVSYPDNDSYEINIGNMLMMSTAGYGYLTILWKNGDKFIDLNNPRINIIKKRNPQITSHTIDYIEPFGNYYTQDGKRKKAISKRKAKVKANDYYNNFHQKHISA